MANTGMTSKQLINYLYFQELTTIMKSLKVEQNMTPLIQ